MLRVWIGGWRHVEHLDPTKAHTGILGMSQDICGFHDCQKYTLDTLVVNYKSFISMFIYR